MATTPPPAADAALMASCKPMLPELMIAPWPWVWLRLAVIETVPSVLIEIAVGVTVSGFASLIVIGALVAEGSRDAPAGRVTLAGRNGCGERTTMTLPA